MIDLNELLNVAINASSVAYEISKNYRVDSVIKNSLGKDIKTIADEQINIAIIQVLHTTGIPIISEESENNVLDNLNGISWIIDPLDGTYNFSRGYKCAGISISLLVDGIFKIGVVRDIFNNDCYSCVHNQGSFINNKPIQVSEILELENAVLATGFPSGLNYDSDNLLGLVQNIQNFKKIRTIGSASIMLSNVASGIFDVYYEKDIYLWDVAAGLALVSESGGRYCLRNTDEKFKYEVLASNHKLFDVAKKMLFENNY